MQTFLFVSTKSTIKGSGNVAKELFTCQMYVCDAWGDHGNQFGGNYLKKTLQWNDYCMYTKYFWSCILKAYFWERV